MKLAICIGSACHVKGSRLVLQQLQKLVADNKLKDKIEISGEFCMNKCTEGDGVSVRIDGEVFSVKPDDTVDFFNKEVLKRLK